MLNTFRVQILIYHTLVSWAFSSFYTQSYAACLKQFIDIIFLENRAFTLLTFILFVLTLQRLVSAKRSHILKETFSRHKA